MQKVPLRAVPNQRLNTVLGDYSCTLHLYQRGDFLYADVTANGTAICTGAMCLANTNIINFPTASFSGLLYFVDMQGYAANPHYEGLGDRYQLYYITAEEQEAFRQELQDV